MTRRWVRLVPAALTVLLLATAALGPPRRVGAGGAESAAAPCEFLVQETAAESAAVLPLMSGVNQPIEMVGTFSACSLHVSWTYSSTAGRFEIVQWDPTLLAPDPTTVALRTLEFNNSQLATNHLRADFTPVVSRRLTHVAEPSRTSLAIDYQTISSGQQSVAFTASGDPGLPEAYAYGTTQIRMPLSGPHPVLSHAVCGHASLQNLYVVQSVMSTTATMDASSYELLQRFRVPWQVTLEWVELAFAPNAATAPHDPGLVAIMAAAPGEPPTALPQFMTQSLFYQEVNDRSRWASNYDFDQTITLMPGQDYWLLVRTAFDYGLHARQLQGNESTDFTNGVGPFYRRTTAAGSWLPIANKALSFRMIGQFTGIVDVPTLPSPGVRLRLQVTPNPARGAALVSWSGAHEAVRFSVVDVRGRRVSTGVASGADGRWLWRGVRDDGRAVPAGVYFVRCTDLAANVATQRVVLVR